MTKRRMTPKRYRCTACKHVSLISTNHYGPCYPRCTNCGWKRPLEAGQVHECLDIPWLAVAFSGVLIENLQYN